MMKPPDGFLVAFLGANIGTFGTRAYGKKH